jgi:hypothetical protein
VDFSFYSDILDHIGIVENVRLVQYHAVIRSADFSCGCVYLFLYLLCALSCRQEAYSFNEQTTEKALSE